MQVENEYGSFGRDLVFMRHTRDQIVRAGLGEVLLFTADGPGQLTAGTLPGVHAVVNFGPGYADSAFARLRRFRPSGPLMGGEYWAGWFDQWGGRHSTTDAEREARELDWMLSRNGYRPQTTSYDYDAAVDEAGRPSRKFALFRDVIARHRPGVTLPEPPAPNPIITIPRFTLDESVLLTAAGLPRRPVRAERPLTFEALGVDFGYVLYRARLAGPAEGTLVIGGLRDYAVVTVNGAVAGALDRRLRQDSLAITVPAAGVLSAVQASVPPTVYRGTFRLDSIGDTWLDLRGWGKGVVWVNGHNLGRFWDIGPQRTLYLPGPWLRRGANEVIVLDLRPQGNPTIEGVGGPVFEP